MERKYAYDAETGLSFLDETGRTSLANSDVAFSFRLEDAVRLDFHAPDGAGETAGKDYFLQNHGRAERVLSDAKPFFGFLKFLGPETKTLTIPSACFKDPDMARDLVATMNDILDMGRLMPDSEAIVTETVSRMTTPTDPFRAEPENPSATSRPEL